MWGGHRRDCDQGYTRYDLLVVDSPAKITPWPPPFEVPKDYRDPKVSCRRSSVYLGRKGKAAPRYLILKMSTGSETSPIREAGTCNTIGLLSDLGYLVEWRVINAADYGFPQRRRRVFIVTTDPQPWERSEKNGLKDAVDSKDSCPTSSRLLMIGKEWSKRRRSRPSQRDHGQFQQHFQEGALPFMTAGAMMDRRFVTCKYESRFGGDTDPWRHPSSSRFCS